MSKFFLKSAYDNTCLPHSVKVPNHVRSILKANQSA